MCGDFCSVAWQLTTRGKLRILLDSSKVELATVSLVLLYLLVIVIDIALPDVAFPCDADVKDAWQVRRLLVGKGRSG